MGYRRVRACADDTITTPSSSCSIAAMRVRRIRADPAHHSGEGIAEDVAAERHVPQDIGIVFAGAVVQRLGEHGHRRDAGLRVQVPDRVPRRGPETGDDVRLREPEPAHVAFAGAGRARHLSA